MCSECILHNVFIWLWELLLYLLTLEEEGKIWSKSLHHKTKSAHRNEETRAHTCLFHPSLFDTHARRQTHLRRARRERETANEHPPTHRFVETGAHMAASYTYTHTHTHTHFLFFTSCLCSLSLTHTHTRHHVNDLAHLRKKGDCSRMGGACPDLIPQSWQPIKNHSQFISHLGLILIRI